MSDTGRRPFGDHFSGCALEYRRARPTYPEILFDALASVTEHRDWAWDVGCGSGQATDALAQRFSRVIATEPSLQQLAQASIRHRGRLVVAPAEADLFARPFVDLVAAAQAAHWFDMERFGAVVRRVARPGALVAVWCYRTLVLSEPELDGVIQSFYSDELGPWWPAGREHIDAGYASLHFPFDELAPPSFEMARDWSLAELLDYLETWSAVQHKRSATGSDPVAELGRQLGAMWKGGTRRVRWPLGMRWGKV